MSQGCYLGINNCAKLINGAYIGVNNVAKRICNAYIGINNVAVPIWGPQGQICYALYYYDAANYNSYLVFQPDTTKSLTYPLNNTYSFNTSAIENNKSFPWDIYRSREIEYVSFCNGVNTQKLDYWFYYFDNCKSIDFTNFDTSKVTSISNTFYNCCSLTGSPFYFENVTNMYYAYAKCNFTGQPTCGEKVKDLSYAYYECRKLTGYPVCGSRVKTMRYSYRNCYNLTGTPVCGNNVTDMSYTYYNCKNLTGPSACGNNVTNMYYTYYNCVNLSACDSYWYSNNVKNVCNCFYNKNNSRRYNIHVPKNSTTLNTCLYNNTSSMVGKNIAWTNAGTYHYNTAYNIYIYPDI